MLGIQSFVSDTNFYVYQEMTGGSISAASGLDSVSSTWRLSVLSSAGASTSDIPPIIEVDPSGNITLFPVGVLELVGDMTGTNDITLISTTASSSANSFSFDKSRSGSTIVSGDTLGSLLWAGHDGTQYITASQIKSVSSGTVATNRIASNLLFYTHPDSTTASTLRMTIAPAGNVTIAAPDSGVALTISGGGLTSTGTTTLSSLSAGVVQTNSSGVISSSNGTNGQLLIGGGSAPAWANLASAGGTITIANSANGIDLSLTSSIASSYSSDSGTATPLAGVINLHGGTNIGTTGAGSTVTFNLDNTVSISGSMTAGTGFTATTGNVVVTAGNITLPGTNAAGTQGIIVKDGGRWASDYGTNNCFVGNNSGNTSLTVGSAIYNTGFGDFVLQSLTTGRSNNSFGYNSLSSVTSGDYNTSNGNAGLTDLTTGSRNTAIGREAGVQLISGNENLLLGYEAGRNYTSSESDNIMLANYGTAGESGRIRIGTSGTHTACNIQGIAGVTVSSSSAVLINTSNGQLGTIVSARKYKKDINPIGKSSMNLLDLEPVQFKYIDDESDELHYGLIADDVANLYADLVVFNENHEPETVKYHELPALLLNELKRAMRRIDELERRLDARS